MYVLRCLLHSQHTWALKVSLSTHALTHTHTNLFVDVREVFHCDHIDVLVSPHPLLVVYQSVLKQSQSFVGPHPDQTLDGQCLYWFEGLVDPLDPAGHLSRGVDVVRLHLLCEPLLYGVVCVCVCVCERERERERKLITFRQSNDATFRKGLKHNAPWF